MLVDMERSYITAGFFRYTMGRRFEASQSQAAVQQALNKDKGGTSKKGFLGFGGGGGDNAAAAAAAPPGGRASPSDGLGLPGRPSSGGGAEGGLSLGSLADPNDYIAAHFDKKVRGGRAAACAV
jgi:dynamin GTPase